MRRTLIPGLVLVAAVLGVFIWSRAAPVTPPGLLLVTIDTLRADRVGAYGSSAGLTPALDDLAASGWVFEQVVSAVPLTLPSHATILSGLDPRHHGVRNNGTYVFPQTQATLATRLHEQGFGTAAFVAAVVLDRRYGLARGFDVYDDRITRVSEGRSVLESERSCEDVTRSAIAWIQSQSGKFFAWVHFYEPHAPYNPPSGPAGSSVGSAYDGEVATADQCLATLMTAARAARPGRLVTAVTSDHGEGLGEHGESAHGLFLYQSTLRVPMVISGPGVPSGKRQSGLVRSADLAPTLLSILGSPPFDRSDGRDLTQGTGGGEAYSESDFAKGFGWAPLRSWRLGDLKLIEAPAAELYDLARDPREERNLASTQPNDVARLRAVLKAALASEVRADERRVSAEVGERLKSLGYVSGGGATVDAARALDPKEALPLFQTFERAMESEASGDLGSSSGILVGLVKRDPGNLTFQRSLASALRRSSRAGEAIRVLRTAERLAPKDAAIAHDLALVLAEEGRQIEAIESEHRAIAIDPKFVEALDHLATLEAIRGDLVKAREAVDRALAIDANYAQAWSNRGNVARAQGLADDAAKSYGRALELSPELVDAVNGLGVLAVERGDLDEAVVLFNRALELSPAFDESRLNLAVVESQRGNVERAITLAVETEKGARDPALRAKASAFLKDLRKAVR